MRQVTRSKLKKWSIGAGCTLTAALIFNQVQSGEAFAQARKEAAAAGSGTAGKQEIASQDRVRQEFEGFKDDRHKKRLAHDPSISAPSSPSVSSKPSGRTRHS